jgi:hypothetical protein
MVTMYAHVLIHYAPDPYRGRGITLFEGLRIRMMTRMQNSKNLTPTFHIWYF